MPDPPILLRVDKDQSYIWSVMIYSIKPAPSVCVRVCGCSCGCNPVWATALWTWHVAGGDFASVSVLRDAFVLQTDGAEKQEGRLPVH